MPVTSFGNDLGTPEFADEIRAAAGKLMHSYPAAATHLVLAAASISPTCPDEKGVAEYYADLLAPFTEQISRIHHRRTATATQQWRRPRNGAR